MRLSNQSSIFSFAHAQELTTAAAAYHWISELYNRAPFDPVRDRFTHDSSMAIQNGLFYWQDHYPDDHLYAEAEYLRTHYNRDFMLVLSMNVDNAGHHFGLYSSLIGLIIAIIGAYSLNRITGRLKNAFASFCQMVANFSGVPLAFAFIIIIGTNATAFALTSGSYNLMTIRIGHLIAGDLFLAPWLAGALSMYLVDILVTITLLNEYLIQTRKRHGYT